MTQGQQAADGIAEDVTLPGVDDVAARVIALARECGIAIHESPDLVWLLAQMPPAGAVPAGVYRAVAEVLAFLARTAASQGGLARDP